jgi:hypothetical protein
MIKTYCLKLGEHTTQKHLEGHGLKTDTRADRIALEQHIVVLEKRLAQTGVVDLSAAGLPATRANRRLAFEIEKFHALQKNPGLTAVYADREAKMARSVL